MTRSTKVNDFSGCFAGPRKPDHAAGTTGVTGHTHPLEFRSPFGFMRGASREPLVLLALLAGALVVSGISPRDRLTWVLEEMPIFLGVPVLIATFRRHRLTRLTYRLIFFHAIVLTIGGHYTFSAVPAGLWLRDALGLARNHFDRIVHLIGGLVPAIFAREVFLRRTRLRPGGWLFLIVTLSSLGGGALYEILEWWAAKVAGMDAWAFLAIQGDVWDTQWDLFLDLSGAIAGQLLLAGRQDRELAEMGRATSSPLPDFQDKIRWSRRSASADTVRPGSNFDAGSQRARE